MTDSLAAVAVPLVGVLIAVVGWFLARTLNHLDNTVRVLGETTSSLAVEVRLLQEASTGREQRLETLGNTTSGLAVDVRLLQQTLSGEEQRLEALERQAEATEQRLHAADLRDAAAGLVAPAPATTA